MSPLDRQLAEFMIAEMRTLVRDEVGRAVERVRSEPPPSPADITATHSLEAIHLEARRWQDRLRRKEVIERRTMGAIRVVWWKLAAAMIFAAWQAVLGYLAVRRH